MYRSGLLFLVLIFGATYTANLAAFLTKPNFKLHGPQTMEDLRLSRACWRWPGFTEMSSFVSELVLPPTDMPLLEREAWARQQLQSGGCDAIIEIAVNAKKESLQHW